MFLSHALILLCHLYTITGLHDTAYSYNYFGGDSVLKALLVYKFEMTLNVTYWNRQEVWKFRPRNCKDSWSLDELLFCQGDDVASPDMLPPPAGDFTPSNCWNFTIGDLQRKEFYSPNFPENYLNNTECMQLLTAPRGYIIRLDFRDDFHIETSEECKYDYLELRDGPFGYSPLIGRFCGKKHPPLVDSTSRFLWIRFQSDESIEYSGFRAVYEFVKPSKQVCRIDVKVTDKKGRVQILEGSSSTTEIPERFLIEDEPVDCTWVLYAPPGHRFYMRWVDFTMSTPQNCDDSFMELYDRTTATSDRRKQVCGLAAKEFKSVSNHVYMRVFALNPSLLPSFQTQFTVFTPGPCTSSQFDCGDDSCVPSSLQCNGNVNCNYSWDEEGCDVSPPTTEAPVDQPIVITYSTIILGVVGGFIVTIISLAVLVTCHQHRKEEKRHQMALKQEQRQNVEMKTLLNRSSSPCLTRAANHVDKENRNGDISGKCDRLGDGTFQRFQEDDTIPNPPCSSVVCIEKHSSPGKLKPKRETYPEQNSIRNQADARPRLSQMPRRLSLETINSDRSDVWKPSNTLIAQHSVDSILPYHEDYRPKSASRVYGFDQNESGFRPSRSDGGRLHRVSHSASNELDLYDQPDVPRPDSRHTPIYRSSFPYSRTFSGSLNDPRPRNRDFENYEHARRNYRPYDLGDYGEVRDHRESRDYDVYRDHSRDYPRDHPRDHSRDRQSRDLKRERSLEKDDRRYSQSQARSPRRESRSSRMERQPSQDSTERRRRSPVEMHRTKTKRDTPSPDMFYSRPNRSIQQHHPV